MRIWKQRNTLPGVELRRNISACIPIPTPAFETITYSVYTFTNSLAFRSTKDIIVPTEGLKPAPGVINLSKRDIKETPSRDTFSPIPKEMTSLPKPQGEKQPKSHIEYLFTSNPSGPFQARRVRITSHSPIASDSIRNRLVSPARNYTHTSNVPLPPMHTCTLYIQQRARTDIH